MKSVALLERWPFLVVLLLLCAFLAVSGCSRNAKKTPAPGEEWADDLRSRIDRHIDDPQKKSQLMNLVDQDVDIFKELSQATVTDSGKLLVVDKNYLSTPEDFRAVFAEYNQTRYRLRTQSMDIRFKMQALCTPEEWKHISHFRTKKGLFNQLTQSPGIN